MDYELKYIIYADTVQKYLSIYFSYMLKNRVCLQQTEKMNQ